MQVRGLYVLLFVTLLATVKGDDSACLASDGKCPAGMMGPMTLTVGTIPFQEFCSTSFQTVSDPTFGVQVGDKTFTSPDQVPKCSSVSLVERIQSR
eukprot:CAMPEP_0203746568 /NCGR_PEP_ID=MMETSP0098-20131031/1971_1 /ASSEMBLY_ACC=CAM_ASM_000208 /TAXON_ID=96639 /ORGANISM=" , Strain NY0313808BC1" /LENGTH=95 /DNA_ID=CAMNT_0050634707 /DNA_START=799 /DNA_END=1082 /DNA_ORIENTATION=-